MTEAEIATRIAAKLTGTTRHDGSWGQALYEYADEHFGGILHKQGHYTYASYRLGHMREGRTHSKNPSLRNVPSGSVTVFATGTVAAVGFPPDIEHA